VETREDRFETSMQVETEDILEVLASSSTPLPKQPVSVMPACAYIARFQGFDLDERPIVSGLLEAPSQMVTARTTVSLLHTSVGSEVVVVCEENDFRRPIIIGVLQERQAAPVHADSQRHSLPVQVDDQRHVLSAEREIVLRCGDASITLTRAGKILIRGAYVSSSSSGVNRIKGGSVQIN
jgi:hypothetical protein